MARRSGKKFSLKSGPLKSSGFKQMGSPMNQIGGNPKDYQWQRPEGYRPDIYEITKTPMDFDGWGPNDRKNGKLSRKERKAYEEYVANMKKKYNADTTKGRRNRAHQGDNTNILSDRQKKINASQARKNKPPRFMEHVGPDGFVYIATLNNDGTIKSLKQPGGSTSGLNQDQRDYMRHADDHGDNWKEHADKLRAEDQAQKELEATWRDDIRTKHNTEGGPRFYMSDSAHQYHDKSGGKGFDYGRHDTGLNEGDEGYHGGYSRVYFRGADDKRKLERLSRSKNLNDEQRQQLRNMLVNYNDNNGIYLNFKDDQIESNYMMYDDPSVSGSNPRRMAVEGNMMYGSFHRGGDGTTKGSTDPALTRMLVDLTQTGNRLPNNYKAGNQDDNQNKNANAVMQNNTAVIPGPAVDPNKKQIQNAKIDVNGNVIELDGPDGNPIDTTGNTDVDINNNVDVNANNTTTNTDLVEGTDSGRKHQEGSFGEAFKAARADGRADFPWRGQMYHTRQANESLEDWQNKFNTTNQAPGPTPGGADPALTGDAEEYIDVPGQPGIKVNAMTGEVVKMDDLKNQGADAQSNMVKHSDKDSTTRLEQKTIDRIPTAYDDAKLPEINTNVEPIDYQDQDAYGASGEPQSVERDDYEPQSTQSDDDDDDDDS